MLKIYGRLASAVSLDLDCGVQLHRVGFCRVVATPATSIAPGEKVFVSDKATKRLIPGVCVHSCSIMDIFRALHQKLFSICHKPPYRNTLTRKPEVHLAYC